MNTALKLRSDRIVQDWRREVVSAQTRTPIMTKLLISACAAALIGIAASSASAGDFTIPGDGRSGAIIPVDDDGYGRHYGYERDDDDDNWKRRGGWGKGWGHGYAHRGVVQPHRIVRQLARHHFTHITQPVLAGWHYQVKARDPRGRKVKLYINAYTGEIDRWKFRG
jgi:hypothetical protein